MTIKQLLLSLNENQSPFIWGAFVFQQTLRIEEYTMLAKVYNKHFKVVYRYKRDIHVSLQRPPSGHDARFAELLRTSRPEMFGINIKHNSVAYRYEGGEYRINNTAKKQFLCP